MNLFEQAKQYIPGGVNSPVRAFQVLAVSRYFLNPQKGLI